MILQVDHYFEYHVEWIITIKAYKYLFYANILQTNSVPNGMEAFKVRQHIEELRYDMDLNVTLAEFSDGW